MNQPESQQAGVEQADIAQFSPPKDPRSGYHSGPFPQQEQKQPGLTGLMDPAPDHGEHSYAGHGRLTHKAALITGGDSGIGAAVGIAFAREGADVAFSHLPEEAEDARNTTDWIRKAGTRALPLPGDARSEEFCQSIVERAVDEFGRLDIGKDDMDMDQEHSAEEEVAGGYGTPTPEQETAGPGDQKAKPQDSESGSTSEAVSDGLASAPSADAELDESNTGSTEDNPKEHEHGYR